MESLRSIGSIVVGAVGFAVGGPLGFAISTVLFNVIVPPKTPTAEDRAGASQGDKNTAIGTGILQVFGKYEREGGSLIRCAKDADGARTGIIVITREEKVGGSRGSGGGGKKQKVKRDYQYLAASFELCKGLTRVSRVIEKNGKEGEVVKWVRGNSLKFRGDWDDGKLYKVGEQVKHRKKFWECLQEHVSTNSLNPGDQDNDAPAQNWVTYWVKVADPKNQINFQPIFGAITGQEIGLMSETMRIYYGSEEQPVDSAEAGWYDDGVSADKGICKVVFNRYGALENGTVHKFLLENDLSNRREIILDRARDAGIPTSRVFLDSISTGTHDTGWYVEGREPARNLAEEVAALSFHDLHFLARDVGMCFTDISRSNPTRFVLTDEEMGAFANTDGGGSPPSSSNITVQGGEQKPRELKVEFINFDKNFKNDSPVVFWQQANGEPQVITLRVVDRIDKLTDFCTVAMREIQATEGTTEVSLLPSFCQVAPGCALDAPEEEPGEVDGRRLLRVVGQTITPEIMVSNSCAPFDPLAFAPVPLHPVVTEAAPEPVGIALPQVLILDTVNVADETVETPTALMAAFVENGESFRGAVVSTESGAFDEVELPNLALVGKTLTAYNFGNAELGKFDYTRTIRVQIKSGYLSSCSEDDVRAGANLLYVGGVILAFTTATPVAIRTYELTGLLTGLFGTDFIRAVPIGAWVVQFTDEIGSSGAIVPVTWTRRFLGAPVPYIVASAYDPEKESDDLEATVAGVNLKALGIDPVVVKGFDSAPVILVDPDTGEPLPPEEQPAFTPGYFVKFFGRSRYPENSADVLMAGLPYRQSDPLSWTVQLFDGAVLADERIVVSTSSEVEVHYTRAALMAAFGAFPQTLTGKIFQNGTYGPGFVVEFSV